MPLFSNNSAAILKLVLVDLASGKALFEDVERRPAWRRIVRRHRAVPGASYSIEATGKQSQ